MKIIDIDLDGVVADLEKGQNQYFISNIAPLKGRPGKLPPLSYKKSCLDLKY